MGMVLNSISVQTNSHCYVEMIARQRILIVSPLNMTTDWHWLKLCMRGEELSVRLWKDEVEEPDEWDMINRVSTSKRLVGKALLSFINFDYENGNTFYLDEIIVNDLGE